MRQMGDRDRQFRRKKNFRKKTAGYEVFLSHSHRDLWIAQVLKEKIEALRRTSVWLDEMSLQGGDNVMQAVVEGIGAADEAIVLVSHEALRSQWVATEIGIATAKKKRITPILNNVEPDAFVPLKGAKSYELNSFEKFLAELTRRAGRRKRP